MIRYHMTFTKTAVCTVSLLALLQLGTACGGEDPEDDTNSSTTGGAGGDEGGGSGGTSSGGGSTGGNDGTGGSPSTCLADSNELSGSSTVVWNDGEIADGLTMVFGADDDTLTPNTLTVPVNERFGIENPVGGPIRAVKVGCAGGQTLSANITAGFIINAPGTYEIIDEAANNYVGVKVGTVNVE